MQLETWNKIIHNLQSGFDRPAQQLLQSFYTNVKKRAIENTRIYFQLLRHKLSLSKRMAGWQTIFGCFNNTHWSKPTIITTKIKTQFNGLPAELILQDSTQRVPSRGSFAEPANKQSYYQPRPCAGHGDPSIYPSTSGEQDRIISITKDNKRNNSRKDDRNNKVLGDVEDSVPSPYLYSNKPQLESNDKVR